MKVFDHISDDLIFNFSVGFVFGEVAVESIQSFKGGAHLNDLL